MNTRLNTVVARIAKEFSLHRLIGASRAPAPCTRNAHTLAPSSDPRPLARFFKQAEADATPDIVKERLSESGYRGIRGIWRISRGSDNYFVATAYESGRAYRVFADPRTGKPFARTQLQEV